MHSSTSSVAGSRTANHTASRAVGSCCLRAWVRACTRAARTVPAAGPRRRTACEQTLHSPALGSRARVDVRCGSPVATARGRRGHTPPTDWAASADASLSAGCPRSSQDQTVVVPLPICAAIAARLSPCARRRHICSYSTARAARRVRCACASEGACLSQDSC
jgi:hypothetical protein